MWTLTLTPIPTLTLTQNLTLILALYWGQMAMITLTFKNFVIWDIIAWAIVAGANMEMGSLKYQAELLKPRRY